MKSRIRSRWHRADEKPLENDGSPTPTAPFGEIDPSNNATLTDDLSNYKPSENSQSSRPHQKQSSNMDERRGNRNRGDNRRPRQKRDRKEDTSNGEKQSSDNNHSGKERGMKIETVLPEVIRKNPEIIRTKIEGLTNQRTKNLPSHQD